MSRHLVSGSSRGKPFVDVIVLSAGELLKLLGLSEAMLGVRGLIDWHPSELAAAGHTATASLLLYCRCCTATAVLPLLRASVVLQSDH